MKTPQVDHGVIHDGQEITTPLGMKRNPKPGSLSVLLVNVTSSPAGSYDIYLDLSEEGVGKYVWCHNLEGEINPHKLLEGVYQMQGNNPWGIKVHDDQPTIAVGDLIWYEQDEDEADRNGYALIARGDRYIRCFIVAPVGFIEIGFTTLKAWQSLSDIDRPFFARELARIKTLR